MSSYEQSLVEKALSLQEMLVSRATGGGADDGEYRELRTELLEVVGLSGLVPSFVRTCRNLDMFWSWIKAETAIPGRSGRYGQYGMRTKLIREAFGPLLDHLEGKNKAPHDEGVSTLLRTFDEEGIHRAWAKALERRRSDPEGAITSARTLLETVCKRILSEKAVPYAEKDDLPKLYHATSQVLRIAPSQHTEQVFKEILGSCSNIVNSLGTLRNRISDAHAPMLDDSNGKRPVRPSERHAALAVNIAGTLATFLVETYHAREGNGGA